MTISEVGDGGPGQTPATKDEPWPDRLERVGAVLTVVGIAALAGVLLLQDQLGGATPLIGGLALNAAIVGPMFAGRRLAPRLRDRLPRWLGW